MGGIGDQIPAFARFEVQIMSHCGLSAQQLDVVYAAGQAEFCARSVALSKGSVTLLMYQLCRPALV